MAKHGLTVHFARRQGLLAVADQTWCGVDWSAKLKVSHSPRNVNCEPCIERARAAKVPPALTLSGETKPKGTPWSTP